MLGKLWLLPDKVKSVKAIEFLFWGGRGAQMNEGRGVAPVDGGRGPSLGAPHPGRAQGPAVG